MRCYDEGTLRAYLDDALTTAEYTTVGAHVSGCAACRAQLAELRALTTQIGALLATPADIPDPQLALAQLRATAADHQVNDAIPELDEGQGWRPSTTKQPTTHV